MHNRPQHEHARFPINNTRHQTAQANAEREEFEFSSSPSLHLGQQQLNFESSTSSRDLSTAILSDFASARMLPSRIGLNHEAQGKPHSTWQGTNNAQPWHQPATVLGQYTPTLVEHEATASLKQVQLAGATHGVSNACVFRDAVVSSQVNLSHQMKTPSAGQQPVVLFTSSVSTNYPAASFTPQPPVHSSLQPRVGVVTQPHVQATSRSVEQQLKPSAVTSERILPFATGEAAHPAPEQLYSGLADEEFMRSGSMKVPNHTVDEGGGHNSSIHDPQCVGSYDSLPPSQFPVLQQKQPVQSATPKTNVEVQSYSLLHRGSTVQSSTSNSCATSRNIPESIRPEEQGNTLWRQTSVQYLSQHHPVQQQFPNKETYYLLPSISEECHDHRKDRRDYESQLPQRWITASQTSLPARTFYKEDSMQPNAVPQRPPSYTKPEAGRPLKKKTAIPVQNSSHFELQIPSVYYTGQAPQANSSREELGITPRVAPAVAGTGAGAAAQPPFISQPPNFHGTPQAVDCSASSSRFRSPPGGSQSSLPLQTQQQNSALELSTSTVCGRSRNNQELDGLEEQSNFSQRQTPLPSFSHRQDHHILQQRTHLNGREYVSSRKPYETLVRDSQMAAHSYVHGASHTSVMKQQDQHMEERELRNELLLMLMEKDREIEHLKSLIPSGRQEASNRSRQTYPQVGEGRRTFLTSADCQSTENAAFGLDSVIRAVVRWGCDQYFNIGLELKMTYPQIKDIVCDVPNGQQKLRLVIETRRQEVGNEAVTYELLNACKTISTPIIGAVLQELRDVGHLEGGST